MPNRHRRRSLIEAAVMDEVDIVVNALLGSVGLIPTLKAIEQKNNCACK